MSSQINTDLQFAAHYTENGVGKSGLTVSVDVWNPAKSQIVTDGSGTQQGRGLYYYVLDSSLNDAEGDYLAVFRCSDTSLDRREIPFVVSVGKVNANLLQWRGTQPSNLDGSNRILANVESNNLSVNVSGWRGTQPNALVDGNVPAEVTGVVQATVSDTVDANITQVGGSNIPTPNVNGYLPVDIVLLSGHVYRNEDGIAQGGSATTIILDGTSPTNDTLNNTVLLLNDGQSRIITDYVGATRTATVHKPWTVNPVSGSTTYRLGGPADATLFEAISANVSGWLGEEPLALDNGNVQAVTTGNVTVDVSNLSVNVSGWLGEVPNALSDGNLQASIGVSGIDRDTFALLGELTGVPSAPYNPLDLVNFLYAERFNRTLTTSGNYTIYKENGTDVLSTVELLDAGNSFLKFGATE